MIIERPIPESKSGNSDLVFFFTILGRDAGRRELLELDILLATAFQISGWFSTDPHA